MQEPKIMLCSVCGRVLDYQEGRGYFHAQIDRDLGVDHLEVPVPQTPEFQGKLRCDFCMTDNPTKEIPARSFSVAPGQMSEGDWAACDVCADLIFYGRWKKLIQRAAKHSKTGLAPDALEEGLRFLYNALRKNMTGPPRDITPL